MERKGERIRDKTGFWFAVAPPPFHASRRWQGQHTGLLRAQGPWIWPGGRRAPRSRRLRVATQNLLSLREVERNGHRTRAHHARALHRANTPGVDLSVLDWPSGRRRAHASSSTVSLRVKAERMATVGVRAGFSILSFLSLHLFIRSTSAPSRRSTP